MAQGPNDPDDPQDRKTAYMFDAEPPQAEPAGEGTRAPTIPIPGDATSRAPESPLPGGPASPIPSGSSTGGSSGFTGRLEPGQVVFDKYIVVRLLGQGGMGTVWLVKHRELDIERALKLIVSGVATDADARARFKREARVMALFSHPNAVAVHDARMSHDVAFIEMEYVRGRSISTMLDPGVPLPLDWTARILVQLCDVLQVAHDHAIVHRDLKPSNLMLVDGRPPGQELLKVLDFGIAKILGTDQLEFDDVRTHTGMFIGTAPYSSPDQASKGVVDHRSDLYSVGIIVYEFLTGYRPFSGPTTIYDHLHTTPAPFKVKNPQVNVPAEVEQVVMRCLAKNPDDRPQSAHELAQEFMKALGPNAPTAGPFSPTKDAYSKKTPPQEWAQTTERFVEPSVALPATEPASGVRPGRRPPIAALVSVAAALVLVLGLGTFWHSTHRPNPIDITPIPKIGKGSKSETPPVAVPSFPPQKYEPEAGAEMVNGLPIKLVRRSDRTRFILIEGGDFKMGAADNPPAGGSNSDDLVLRDEQPAHLVRVSSFYLQETEVTIGEMRVFFRESHTEQTKWPQYFMDAWNDLVVKKGLKEEDADRYPAAGISRTMAEEFATWAGGRLPTEAEWEFAMRSRGQDRKYVWGNSPEPSYRQANIDNANDPFLKPVKSYQSDRTEQGIYDMTGNVREWCLDPWSPYADLAETLVNPPRVTSSSANDKYIIRGGSWSTSIDEGRTTYRAENECQPGYHEHNDLGFRIVLEVPPDRLPKPTH